MIYVANVKTYSFKNFPSGAASVYIGRAMPGRKGSPLGNPFKLAKGESCARREACLEKYRAWVRKQDAIGPVWNEIHRLATIAQHFDLVLLCWCAPEACHGDVVRELIEDEWEQPRGFFKPRDEAARPAPAGYESPYTWCVCGHPASAHSPACGCGCQSYDRVTAPDGSEDEAR